MKEFRSCVTPFLKSYASQPEKTKTKQKRHGDRGRYSWIRLLSLYPIKFHLIKYLNADTFRVKHMFTIVASDMQSINTHHSIAHVCDHEYPPVID